MFFGYNNSFHFFYKFLKRNTLFFCLYSLSSPPPTLEIYSSRDHSVKKKYIFKKENIVDLA